MGEHQKIVAKRWSHLEEKRFYKYLRYCGWSDSEIAAMWRYAQRKEKENERI